MTVTVVVVCRFSFFRSFHMGFFLIQINDDDDDDDDDDYYNYSPNANTATTATTVFNFYTISFFSSYFGSTIMIFLGIMKLLQQDL